jgi:hypothetical protein
VSYRVSIEIDPEFERGAAIFFGFANAKLRVPPTSRQSYMAEGLEESVEEDWAWPFSSPVTWSRTEATKFDKPSLRASRM